jgi:predicted nucleotidyltransferase
MATIAPGSPLYDLDMIQIQSGEILSVVGNYDGPQVRARLTFYPSSQGDRLINGITYRKVRIERGHVIPGCVKVLASPGEEHFILDRSLITTVYPASQGFQHLTPAEEATCNDLKDLFYAYCQVNSNNHGLTGSSAMGIRQPSSDFDWVIYQRAHTEVKQFVTQDQRFTREMTFDMSLIYDKYRDFSGFTKADLDKLYSRRWKYFHYGMLHVSVSFVNPALKADPLLVSFYGHPVKLTGTILNADGCYYTPRSILIESNGNKYEVASWLFMNSGAFEDGDPVEVVGRSCYVGTQEFIMVETPDDFIRILS